MDIRGHLINVLSAVAAIEYIDYSFKKKYRGARRWCFFIVSCAVYFAVATVLNRMAESEGVLFFLYGMVVAGYAFLALEGNPQDFLAAGLLWVLIVLIGTYGVFGFMGLASGKGLDEMAGLGSGELLYASLTALVVKFSMGKAASVFFRKKENFQKQESWVIAGAFMLMAMLSMGMFCMNTGSLEISGGYWLTISILVDETGIIVALVVLCQRLGTCQKEKLEEQYRREREQEHMEGLQDLYRVGREINHWRHDMLGELSVLYRMQKNGKYKEVEAYMEELCSSLKDCPELPQPTGNEGLDAALMRAILKCREKGIHFSYVVMGKVEKLDSMALGNLMNNLLDNGLEACLNLAGEGEIELTIQAVEGGLEILLENSIEASVLESNPKLESRKKDKESHGFGMETIRQIVMKHGGSYEYWEEGGRFCQKIFLAC